MPKLWRGFHLLIFNKTLKTLIQQKTSSHLIVALIATLYKELWFIICITAKCLVIIWFCLLIPTFKDSTTYIESLYQYSRYSKYITTIVRWWFHHPNVTMSYSKVNMPLTHSMNMWVDINLLALGSGQLHTSVSLGNEHHSHWRLGGH
jgi:hypothetical protein